MGLVTGFVIGGLRWVRSENADGGGIVPEMREVGRRTHKAKVRGRAASPRLSSPANAGDPVFQRSQRWNREAAAYWILRFRGG